jgi:hypothetical protein
LDPDDESYELIQLLKNENIKSEIDSKELIFLAELGHGSYSVVYKGNQLFKSNKQKPKKK